MKIQLCTRIKSDGVRCGSPAIRGTRYCYYHIEDRSRKNRLLQAMRVRERSLLTAPTPSQLRAAALPEINSPQDLAQALNDVMSALWLGQLDHRSAGQILYALNQLRKDRFSRSATMRPQEQLQGGDEVAGASGKPR